MLVMEALNIIGCVTAVVEFLWCLGPLQHFSDQPLTDEALNEWSPKLRQLLVASDAALILCGLLTDAILVRSILYNIIQYPIK